MEGGTRRGALPLAQSPDTCSRKALCPRRRRGAGVERARSRETQQRALRRAAGRRAELVRRHARRAGFGITSVSFFRPVYSKHLLLCRNNRTSLEQLAQSGDKCLDEPPCASPPTGLCSHICGCPEAVGEAAMLLLGRLLAAGDPWAPAFAA